MERRFDPRSIVTPYAFSVHPDLLGMPLATPWQRLGAILVDLVVIGLISLSGVVPLAVGSTALLFWLAFRKPGRDVFGKVFRIAVGCLGFLVLAVTVLVVLFVRYGDEIEGIARQVGANLQAETGAVPGAELPQSQVRDLLGELLPEDAPWASDVEEMVDEALSRSAAPTVEGEEPSIAQEEAVTDEPSEVLSSAAMDSIDGLNRALQLAQEDQADAEAALRSTQRALEEEQNQEALSWLWGLIDDLGIGFGWAALYLTITHAWWRGTTVGKRIFRIRVVMIDKRPLNWWLSFERAGGYAAGFATGLLGFAQIFWDPNRQAIHDKVSETIVIQDGQVPLPGPWIEEGKTQWARGRHGPQEPPGA